MSALRIILFIIAAILIFFGVLLILAFFSTGSQSGWLIFGLFIILLGFGLIWLAMRQKRAADAAQNVTLNIDLPGNVTMDTIKCQSCGGTLSAKDIQMVAGAPVVNCPYCGTTYQLTEAPKW